MHNMYVHVRACVSANQAPSQGVLMSPQAHACSKHHSFPFRICKMACDSTFARRRFLAAARAQAEVSGQRR